MHRLIVVVVLSIVFISALRAADSPTAAKPNILLIYTDDLGYGDLSCYGATALQTPNVDRIAREGLRFTDGHAPSATCTPSRYAMLTGQYAWRKPGTNILPGDAALIIEPGSTTLPSLLQKAGYATGIVGKWHLGLGEKPGPARAAGEGAGRGPNWNGEIKPGPGEIGFGMTFIMAATADRVPCVFVDGHKVLGGDPGDPIAVSYEHGFAGEPTGAKNPELLRLNPSHGHDQAIVNGVSRIGFMSGGRAALWKDEEMADVFTARARRFIEESAASPGKAPFFLYFATHDPHVPRLPHPRFLGKSGLGPRGDAILQMDWCVGELLATLDRLKLTEQTLVIFSSDNGPVLDDGYRDEAVAKNGNHRPAGPWRGGKYSVYEGGTRVPFLTRWPGRIKPGVSEALVCQVDFLASLAALTGQPLAENEAPDSQNVLPALLGDSPTGRTTLVEHANTLALRSGPWKYVAPKAGPKRSASTNTELGTDLQPQLFQLADDPGETHDLAPAQPEKVAELAAQLAKIRGR